MLWLPINQTKD